METKITYFEKPGAANTDSTLALARQRADELGIRTILAATTIGDTAVKATDVFKGFRIIAVTHSAGFREPNVQDLTEENRKIIEGRGGTVLTAAHAFGGISRALQGGEGSPPPNYTPGDLIATALRTLGQGIKVACEIAIMAADAGLVRTDEEVIAIGGTGRGADAAAVIQPTYAHRFGRLRVKEIICKPRL